MQKSSLVRATLACLAVTLAVAPAAANEIWLLPTYQGDTGGVGVVNSKYWPVTVMGGTRFAAAVPEDFHSLKRAHIVLIPDVAGGGTLQVVVCGAFNADLAGASCTPVIDHPFTGGPQELVEVDVTAAVAQEFNGPGKPYVAVMAMTRPNVRFDHFVGLRISYQTPQPPAGPTLGTNTFTGRQTAPEFEGSGRLLTEVARLDSANTFSGTVTAPAFLGSGRFLSDVGRLQVPNVFTSSNTFQRTPTIERGSVNFESCAGILVAAPPPPSIPCDTSALVTVHGQPFLRGHDPILVIAPTGGSTIEFSNNTLVGLSAGPAISGLRGNTAVGFSALRSTTAGVRNTAVGLNALSSNFHGFENTAVGNGALGANSIGFLNVAVGSNAGLNATGSHNIYLGADVSGVAGESNTMYLGKVGVQTRTFIAGVHGVTPAGATRAVVIDANGQLGTAPAPAPAPEHEGLSDAVVEDLRTQLADQERRIEALEQQLADILRRLAPGASGH